MELSPDVANQCFNVLVRNLGTPNVEYLRWAFIQSVSHLRTTSYRIDSKLLGVTGRFQNDAAIPTVTCAANELNPLREMMIRQANRAIYAITFVKPATKVKHIKISPAKPSSVIKISREKPQATMQDDALIKEDAA